MYINHNSSLKFILIFLLALCIGSCSRKEYEFVVENRTNFRLNTVDFDFCNGSNTISIMPNSSTDVFTLKYKRTALNLVAPGSICITVEDYSDSLNTYTNSEGISYERTRLNDFTKFIITVDTQVTSKPSFNINME